MQWKEITSTRTDPKVMEGLQVHGQAFGVTLHPGALQKVYDDGYC